ncbi:MAG: phage tail length tape measure family protein, partial [Rhizobium sp.]|nr:phage tail length tape measure family protein [Rhizobium sp.]
MVAPLKLSIGVNIDAAGAKSGGVQAQQAVAAIGAEAQRTQTKLQALINSSVGLNSGAANQSAREWVGALALQGKSLDDLRAKYNPLFAVIRAYKAEITSIKTAHAQGALTSAEMTAAITRERQATLASIDAIKGRGAALRQAAANANGVTAASPVGRTPSTNAGAFQTSNIAAQFQDIAVTSAMGMSPLQIALQQGTQLAAVMGTMERPAAGLLAAFTSILSPVSLMTIAVTGLTAASIQYFTSAESGAKTVETLLQEEEEAIKRVRDIWGEAAEQRSRYGRVSTGSALFGLEGSIGDLTKRLKQSVQDGSIGNAITGAINDNRDLVALNAREFRGTSLFKTLKIDLEELHAATLNGSDEVLQLIANLEEVGRSSGNAGIKAMTQDAVAALKPFRDLAEALRDVEREKRR